MMDKSELKIDYIRYKKSYPHKYKELCEKALAVIPHAYSIYSGFSVGAAVLLENGVIITGSNQENMAYPSGMCAERTALYYAHSSYPETKVKAIAIAAYQAEKQTDNYVSPCGACRQVFAETIKRFGDFDVIMLGRAETIEVKASALLPFAFDMAINE